MIKLTTAQTAVNANKTWKLVNDGNDIGINFGTMVWHWFNHDGNNHLWYLHSYSANTGKKSKGDKQKATIERKIVKAAKAPVLASNRQKSDIMKGVFKLNISLEDMKGGAFVSVKGYENSKGEVSNVLINGKVSYSSAKAQDLKKLRALNIDSLPRSINGQAIPRSILVEAKDELIKSLSKPSPVRSQAQKDAYTNLGNGLRIHNDTQVLSMWGLLVRKDILIKGEYKPVNSSLKTLVKKAIKRNLDLATARFRQYTFGNMDEVRLNGIEVAF